MPRKQPNFPIIVWFDFKEFLVHNVHKCNFKKTFPRICSICVETHKLELSGMFCFHIVGLFISLEQQIHHVYCLATTRIYYPWIWKIILCYIGWSFTTISTFKLSCLVFTFIFSPLFFLKYPFALIPSPFHSYPFPTFKIRSIFCVSSSFLTCNM